ncbi:MAG: hypothetical protein KGH50_03495, partial [Candidatus Micrarchaeota archaeon]|nr:hypothetical protein [Candidatus Micrarchaeota archaeon]
GHGSDRVEKAIKSTRSHPLLSVEYEGSKGALIHVVGGTNLTISEATKIGEGITEGLATNANVIFGARMLPELRDEVRVMSIVTGVKAKFGMKREAAAAPTLNVESISRIY